MSAAVEPRVHTVPGAARRVLAWRFDPAVEAISSAAHGGGTGLIDWILNIGVDRGYSRTDLDEHASEIAAELGLQGHGTALFTAVDVRSVRRAECDGVVVHATVGVSKPTWAAERHRPVTPPGKPAEDGEPVHDRVGGESRQIHNTEAEPRTQAARVRSELEQKAQGEAGARAVRDRSKQERQTTGNAEEGSRSPRIRLGTINIVAQLPVGLEPGAAVNATMTITEAKVQALAEAGIDGTGTATDAAVVTWPAAASRERFCGPRSVWGQRLANAVHDAVHSGLPDVSTRRTHTR